jgi:mono/diheme cytochrome c family protein
VNEQDAAPGRPGHPTAPLDASFPDDPPMGSPPDAGLNDGSAPSEGVDGAAPDAGLFPNACVEGLTAGAVDELCASCACGRCPSQAEACAGDASCAAAAACMQASGCAGMRCYCGDDLLGCFWGAKGPCKAAFEVAAGKQGEAEVKKALENPLSALGKAQALVACGRTSKCKVACGPADAHCEFTDLSCQQRYCTEDPLLESLRAKSAAQLETPNIERVSVGGAAVWTQSEGGTVTLKPGDRVVLEGTGFGAGPDVDFSKLLVGNVRVLETDLTMYEQGLDIARQVHYEVPIVRSRWPKDILAWSDERIEFRVPVHVTRGPIKVQVQKRTGANASYVYAGQAHAVIDAQTIRVNDPAFEHRCDVVSTLSDPVASNEVPVTVQNDGLEALVKKGREIFWSYDYNIGLTHNLRGLDWTAIMKKKTKDPITGLVADPLTLFGAYPTVDGEVPAEAIEDVYFDPYPQKNPIPGFLLVLSQQKTAGMTRDSGYVGYRYAESTNPYTGDGQWIGFNCASCHGYRVSWESAPGVTTTKVIAGLPNPRWSMKWAVLGNFKGVVGEEPGPIWDPGTKKVDKTPLIYAMPHGHGEHDLIRFHGEGSFTDNDYGFAPIAIPNVTHYLPIRRSLSHTESYVGFEGSYIHAEEPDGALGSMDADSLKALTAYMAQLDRNDDALRAVGVYRWLKFKGQDALLEGASEGAFVQRGPRAFKGVAQRLDAGKQIFEAHCASCHQDAVDQFTTERMFPLHEVGRFFEPTVYHREMQSVRVTFLRNLYWVQHRGLLSDGHVRNLEDLVHPDRCKEGSALYDRYYTLHPPVALPPAGPDFPEPIAHENPRGDVFRVLRAKGNTETDIARNTFVERYRYFTRVSWDDAHYYWDYQKMRREYGPWELGSPAPIGLPAAPHPWCAASADEVDDLVLYLVSL